MSSGIRNIERTVKRSHDPDCRAANYKGRGSTLGVRNPKAKDLLARLAREANRAAKKEVA